jgi:hypothetical protein
MKQVFAIIRIDYFQDDNVPIENKIAVKEIVFDIKLAEEEVRRLNQLNSDKGCKYFWQTTRFV